MSYFKRTNTQLFSKPRPPITPETKYWSKFGVPVLVKEFGTIDNIDFSPVEPHYFAVTCSVRVQLYNPITRCIVKNFNKFRENAYGGSFRSDGMLLIAGGEEGVLRLFDVNSKSLLRVFKGHSGAVHRTFFTCDKTRIVSFSDDKTVSTWDVPCESRLSTFSGHDDYVRAGCPSPLSPSILLSGSYDGKIRMFDDRKTFDPVITADHGAPVESVIFLPSGGIFVSAGGTDICVWDAFNGGRMLARISQHHKTVTCLRVTSDGSRFLSGSLDRHVKVYSVSTYQMVHSFDYPNAVLSIDISPNDETLVAGMVDGLISVRRQETEIVTVKSKKKKISARYAGDSYRQVPQVDEIAPSNEKWRERKFDEKLRKFNYSAALKLGLCGRYPPRITVSVMLELIRRKGLRQAVAGFDNLDRLLHFLTKHIGDCRFTRTLIDVANIVLDVYWDKIDEVPFTTKNHLKKLKEHLIQECKLTENLVTLQGALQMVLAATSLSTDDYLQQPEEPLEPTTAAQENFIVDVD
ncbi:U3 small nucleolar RNA-associated protein 15 homolog [Lycorma delicatula]|uniref:U3 small nucleolar RNA-associated protein 15 homolog n=1 Tax=Lycorma delicatula TaxID=130591 RepID=UPI003F516224